ncbi:MAG: hypothetical protein AMQ22_01800 [Candidatus Methanofastidiosum methylothiophilum]|uniref:Uncharacterized protein n=1 Tax=Candidatus Methanofastidiosum methylothiophilum TaxID=1705564 RepID=A0A150IV49_9EURY|nr:MAG: hypothetical protein AMQ22_01800 [Candidatus Methanofastidiosum methylthiophilus]
MCETKEVRFYIGFPSGIIYEWEKKIIGAIRRFIGRLNCSDGIDNDGDGNIDYADDKCYAINSIGEKINYELSDEVDVKASEGGIISLGNMRLYIQPNDLPKDLKIRVERIPARGKDVLSFNDEYVIETVGENGDVYFTNGNMIMLYIYYRNEEDVPADLSGLNIAIDDGNGYDSQSSLVDRERRMVAITIDHLSKRKGKKKSDFSFNEGVEKSGSGCFEHNPYQEWRKYKWTDCGYDLCHYGLGQNWSPEYCYYEGDIMQCCECAKEINGRLLTSDECDECSALEIWEIPTVNCVRWEIDETASSCNDIADFINSRGEAGETKYKFEYTIEYMTLQRYRKDSKYCAKYKFVHGNYIKPNFLINYLNWDNPGSCSDEWYRFLEKLEKQEAGHVEIVLDEVNKVNQIIQNSSVENEICESKKAALESDLETGIVQKLMAELNKNIKKRWDKYDSENNYGATQGAILNCNTEGCN